MKARREPLEVEITSGGKRIGALTAAEFMQSMNRPRAFLPALVTEFNAMKEREGDPERAAVKLMRRRKNPVQGSVDYHKRIDFRALDVFVDAINSATRDDVKRAYDTANEAANDMRKPMNDRRVWKKLAILFRAELKEYGRAPNPKRRAAMKSAVNKLKGNPTMARKKKRSAAQIAATKKLVAFNKKRRSKKKTAARRKPTRRAANPARKKATRRKSSRAKRSRTAASGYAQIFKCQGNSVHFLALTTDGHIRWTLTRGDTVRWQSKAEAAKIARRLAKGRKLAGYYVGVANSNVTTAAIVAECKGGKA